MYKIKPDEAISAIEKFEQNLKPEYQKYMQTSASYRLDNQNTLDKHAFMVYPLLFESML